MSSFGSDFFPKSANEMPFLGIGFLLFNLIIGRMSFLVDRMLAFLGR
jgi:hypothetical protein